MELVISIALGVGLSAACGFRVFVPMLVMSVAALSGYVAPAPGFAWVGTYPAAVAFGVATAVELGGYYLPWVDNLLDTVSVPAAAVAGTLCTAAAVTDLGPLATWSVAIIAGGGSAATIGGLTAVVRGASTATTGGVGNPVVSTLEAVASTVLAVVAIVIPLLALIVVSALLFFAIRRILRWRRNRGAPTGSGPGPRPPD